MHKGLLEKSNDTEGSSQDASSTCVSGGAWTATVRLRRGLSRTPTTSEAQSSHVIYYDSEHQRLPDEVIAAGRDRYIAFLQEAGPLAGLDFSGAIDRMCESMATIPELAEAIRGNDLGKASACLDRLADAETRAFAELTRVVGVAGLL